MFSSLYHKKRHLSIDFASELLPKRENIAVAVDFWSVIYYNKREFKKNREVDFL